MFQHWMSVFWLGFKLQRIKVIYHSTSTPSYRHYLQMDSFISPSTLISLSKIFEKQILFSAFLVDFVFPMNTMGQETHTGLLNCILLLLLWEFIIRNVWRTKLDSFHVIELFNHLTVFPISKLKYLYSELFSNTH